MMAVAQQIGESLNENREVLRAAAK